MRAWPLALLLVAAPARAGGVAAVPPDLAAPLSPASLAPIYQSVSALLPPGPRGDGSRGQLAAYLDAGDYARVQTYFKDRMLPAFSASQPLAVRALAKVAPGSARFREGTQLGRVTAAFDALKRPDSAPVAALNEQLRDMGRAADPAEMSAAIDRLFDGVRRRRDAGEISELYARFVLGEAAKPVNGSPLDEARKKSLNSRLGAEMGRYSSEPPPISPP